MDLIRAITMMKASWELFLKDGTTRWGIVLQPFVWRLPKQEPSTPAVTNAMGTDPETNFCFCNKLTTGDATSETLFQ